MAPRRAEANPGCGYSGGCSRGRAVARWAGLAAWGREAAPVVLQWRHLARPLDLGPLLPSAAARGFPWLGKELAAHAVSLCPLQGGRPEPRRARDEDGARRTRARATPGQSRTCGGGRSSPGPASARRRAERSWPRWREGSSSYVPCLLETSVGGLLDEALRASAPAGRTLPWPSR